jgi:glycosyltransferase involved in cell wall biosynthesis
MKAERTGIGRYVENLVNALASVTASGGRERFELWYRLSRYSRREHRLPPPPGWTQHWVQGAIRPRGVAVHHSTDARAPRLGGTKVVATVHDLFSLDVEGYATERFREKKRRRYREIAERADRIIVLSRWTRSRFLKHHPDTPEDRFAVVPGGVEDRFRPASPEQIAAVKKKYGIEGPYALHVGDLSARKNVRGLIAAFEGMNSDAPRLVLAGRPDQRFAGTAVFTGFVDDTDLPALYSGAICVPIVSFLEGFGLTVLEAMACGTPVVSSGRGALEEVTGDVRILVEAEDPDSIREGVLELAGDEDLRRDLSERGRKVAAEYTWRRAAERTLEAYREAAG